MINILYLHAGAEMYGADKILLELVSHIDRKLFNPLVILPCDGVLKRKLEEKNVKTYVINYPILRRKYFNAKGILKYSLSYFKRSNEIISLLREIEFKVDIIHINTMAVLEGIYLKKRLQAKLIWHVHEIIEKPKIISDFLNFLVGKYADECVAVSVAVKKHLITSKYICDKKVIVIYNGIDSKIFNSNVSYEYLFKDFRIPVNSIRVGVIGRINSWKGQNDFLDATVPLLEKYPSLYLFIIGSAFSGEEWRVDKLKDRILTEKYNSRIIYSPFRRDNAAVQNFLNVLVLPSTNPDPLPTVVLEAMACGKPVVGYAYGGIKEMVKNGYNGYLDPPHNKKALSQSLDRLIGNEDKRKILGRNSQKRQKEYFSVSYFVNSFSKVYEQMVG
ncbi:MAG: glycosyltransferase family 4 protein [Liquorilactobacillus ghanensis]|uniref:glycosyltransferase family 4 protein n=1 Tax=Liquorilactobacillus ghanensis TaxID=399370 RepID=UPI0039EA472E